jgi:hypothetical protein
VAPNDPVIVKQFADTVKIVHEYNLPDRLDNDTVRLELENKFKNLELLNNYDKQIKERITQIKKSDEVAPNLILTQRVNNNTQEGYMYGGSSSYFTSKCPDLNKNFLDLNIDFLNPSITKDIAYLRVNIYKFDDPNKDEARTYILEDFYEVKSESNLIRIDNDFSNGKYEIIFGFMFKSDLKQQYPKFYFKKCIVLKT